MATKEEIKELEEELEEKITQKNTIKQLIEKMDKVVSCVEDLNKRVEHLERTIASLNLCVPPTKFEAKNLIDNKYFWWTTMLIIGFLGAGSGALSALVNLFIKK